MKSFESGLLEYPHYTRPAEWEGRTIPEVLRSGDHAKIAAWRKQRAEERYTVTQAGPLGAPQGRSGPDLPLARDKKKERRR
jgi:tRNA (guanine37-N1)-methyltransferase